MCHNYHKRHTGVNIVPYKIITVKYIYKDFVLHGFLSSTLCIGFLPGTILIDTKSVREYLLNILYVRTFKNHHDSL